MSVSLVSSVRRSSTALVRSEHEALYDRLEPLGGLVPLADRGRAVLVVDGVGLDRSSSPAASSSVACDSATAWASSPAGAEAGSPAPRRPRLRAAPRLARPRAAPRWPRPRRRLAGLGLARLLAGLGLARLLAGLGLDRLFALVCLAKAVSIPRPRRGKRGAQLLAHVVDARVMKISDSPALGDPDLTSPGHLQDRENVTTIWCLSCDSVDSPLSTTRSTR